MIALLLAHWRIGAAALALAVSFSAGWTVRAWKCDSDELERVSVVQEEIDAQRKVFDSAAGYLSAQRDVIDRQNHTTTTIIREAFNANPADPDCRAPDAVRSGLQQALEGANAAAAGEPSPAVRGAP